MKTLNFFQQTEKDVSLKHEIDHDLPINEQRCELIEVYEKTIKDYSKLCEEQRRRITALSQKLASLNRESCLYADIQASNEDLMRKLHEQEIVKKSLYDQLVETQGKIKSFLIPKSLPKDYTIINKYCFPLLRIDETTFEFDQIFAALTPSKIVNKTVLSIIDSTLDDADTTIFAYGCTGSGKTYALFGDHDSVSLVPATVHHVLCHKSSSVTMCASEIYNEKVYSILEPTVFSDFESCRKSIESIRLQRATRATPKNPRSSRSHLILKISYLTKNITFVDLAGSESMSELHTKDMRTELSSINCSLLTLKRVIHGLINKDSHLPLRDSKLTHFLSPTFDADHKIVFLFTLDGDKREESKLVLKFSQEVRRVCLKKRRSATKNV